MRIDPSKNAKLNFYIKGVCNALTPSFFYKNQRAKLLQVPLDANTSKRIEYYNKTKEFTLGTDAKTIKEFCKEKKKTYFFDLLKYLKYFDKNFQISYLFGDITHVPTTPTIVKSRPIEGENTNSILMKLNSVRHFIFVNDTLSFEEKKDQVVWRGKCYMPHRLKFLQEFHNHPCCDVGQTNTSGDLRVAWQKNKLSLKQQLEYKFILAIEGNDVASNLKWAMSSNSLVMMTKPKFETWFMEGLLKPNFHYILLQDDYSDLEEKIKYYIQHPNEAKEIIKNAHSYIEQFLDPQTEDIISLKVLKKYFKNSQQYKGKL